MKNGARFGVVGASAALLMVLAGCASDGSGQAADTVTAAPAAQPAVAAPAAAAASPAIVNVHKGSKVVPADGIGACSRAPGCAPVLFDVTGFAPGSTWTVSATSSLAGDVTSPHKLTVNASGTGYTWDGVITFADGMGKVTVGLQGDGTFRSTPANW